MSPALIVREKIGEVGLQVKEVLMIVHRKRRGPMRNGGFPDSMACSARVAALRAALIEGASIPPGR